MTTTDDTLQQLQKAILLNVDDDGVRLAYADRLLELDENDSHAQLIKVGIQLTKIDPFGPVADVTMELHRLLLMTVGERFCAELPINKAMRVSHNQVWSDRGDFIWHRGFVDSITAKAEDWLAIADSVSWNPDQTVECRNCDGSSRIETSDNHFRCWHCDNGRIQRPVPATAQPVRRLTLTSLPPTTFHSIESRTGSLPVLTGYWILPAEWTADGKPFMFDGRHRLDAEIRRKWHWLEIDFNC